MEPTLQPTPSGVPKAVIAVVVLVVLLPVLVWFSRLPSKRDLDERTSVRDRGAEACAALDAPSAGRDEVDAAVEAFEADRQLVLGIAARQTESQLRDGTATEATVRELAEDCRAVYEPGPDS